ncbi:4-hydroxy-tetrahydrodipicolinate synthase [Rickettsiaceae bacterium]|nr:4-hydroxy-tetrahydrodipicolinate synthase [Rickettsiaceae bacterium]
MIFKGVLTALITPFKNGKVDFEALKILLDHQASAVDGVVVGGSTGEGSSLFDEEYYELISFAANYAGKKTKIIAGMGAASTIMAVDKVLTLCKIQNLAGLMCTVPHYVKPEQEGLYQHFEAVSHVSKLPIMLYIHPGRTGCNMSDDVLLRLAKLNNVISVKDASGDMEKPLRILPKLSPDFTVLIGDDAGVLSYNANGGSGCVSVMANIAPKLCKKIDTLWREGDLSGALALQQSIMPAIEVIFAESNPIGVKYALSKLGLCDGQIRLPLTKASSPAAANIDKALKALMEIEANV